MNPRVSTPMFLAFLITLASPAFAADDTYESGTLSFSSSGQSLMGPGPATGDDTVAGSFDFGYSGGADESFSVKTSLAGFDFGFGGGVDVSISQGIQGHILMLDTGEVDIDYPLNVEIDYPEPNSFAQSNIIAIPTRIAPDGDPVLDARTQGMELEIGQTFGYHAAIDSLEICFFDCSGEGIIPLGNVPEKYDTIFGMNSDLGKMYGLGGATDAEMGQWLVDFGLADDYFGIPHEFGFLEDELFGMNGLAGIPVHDITGYSLVDEGQLPTLTAGAVYGNTKATNPFVSEVFWDALSLTKIPFSLSYSVGELTIGWNLGELGPQMDFTQEVDLAFDPTVYIELDFPVAVKWATGPAGSPIPDAASLNAASTSITVLAGDTLFIQYPANNNDPSDVTPTHQMEGAISNLTQNTYEYSLHVGFGLLDLGLPSVTVIPAVVIAGEVITLAVKFPGISITVPSNGEPLISEEATFSTQQETIIDTSWALGGFSDITTAPFTLDPENPIIGLEKEASFVDNNGGGTRTITNSFKVTNDGDVPLHHVQVSDDLSAAFAEADSFIVDSVESCGLTVNMNYDGANDTNLLWDEVGVPDGGNLIAPLGVVTFRENSHIEGAVYAYHVVFRDGASFSYHHDCDSPLYLEYDADCDGTMDCNQ